MARDAEGVRDDSQEDLWARNCVAARRFLFFFVSGGEIFVIRVGALHGGLGDGNADPANVFPGGGLRSPVEFHGKRSCFYLSILRR